MQIVRLNCAFSRNLGRGDDVDGLGAIMRGILKSYLLEGIGVFLAVSPIIALVSYTQKSYWLALLLAEIYSFAGLFMSMSNLTKTFYPITALLGVAGYYETPPINLIESTIVLLLCVCFSVFILVWHRRNGKEDNAHGK